MGGQVDGWTGGRVKRRIFALGTGVALAAAAAAAAQGQRRSGGIPQLRKHGTATQLVVDGAPFLVLGGELGNSSASSLEYLRPFWPKLRAMHLNTVLAPVSWELVEPMEGRFNFATIDSLLAAARANDMRLALLWFGSWKNSMSSYAPAWVKTSQSRFPRTEATRGRGQEILSPFVAANVGADSRAFAALMRHLRSVDGARHTVIMVQVENEIGMIPEARDHSALADSLFSRPVPDALTAYLSRHRRELVPSLRARWDSAGAKTSGTWRDVFGRGLYTDELFMAWFFAQYAERVAAAGKAEYPLPMYVNAALIRPGYVPGQYVSAGPLPHLADVWRAAAPSIDLLAPDIYFPNFVEWTGNYVRSGNPLFVPEVKLDARAPLEAFYAIGAHDAIGFSPFAIESATDADADAIGHAYEVLGELAPQILGAQGRGSMTGVIPRVSFDGSVDDSPQRVTVGSAFASTVSFESPPAQSPATVPHPLGGGLIVALAPDELLIAGSGIVVTFEPMGPGDPIAGILSADEGRFVNGQWRIGRRLNGDQTHQGRHIRLPPGEFTIQRVKLYRYR
jgi:beta-galactosidase GanA